MREAKRRGRKGRARKEREDGGGILMVGGLLACLYHVVTPPLNVPPALSLTCSYFDYLSLF
jgi:hypothetical protein